MINMTHNPLVLTNHYIPMQCLSVASIGDLQVWRGPALPKPSTHSAGSSCIATQHAPPHLLQAFGGIAVERVRGGTRVRGRERGSGCMTGEIKKERKEARS